MGMLVAILLKVLCTRLHARSFGMSKLRVLSSICGVSDAALSRILARVKKEPSLLDDAQLHAKR